VDELAFDTECRFIRRCTDIPELRDRMMEYRDAARSAERSGDYTGCRRAEDLVDRAEERMTTLKAAQRSAFTGALDPTPRSKSESSRRARAQQQGRREEPRPGGRVAAKRPSQVSSVRPPLSAAPARPAPPPAPRHPPRIQPGRDDMVPSHRGGDLDRIEERLRSTQAELASCQADIDEGDAEQEDIGERESLVAEAEQRLDLMRAQLAKARGQRERAAQERRSAAARLAAREQALRRQQEELQAALDAEQAAARQAERFGARSSDVEASEAPLPSPRPPVSDSGSAVASTPAACGLEPTQAPLPVAAVAAPSTSATPAPGTRQAADVNAMGLASLSGQAGCGLSPTPAHTSTSSPHPCPQGGGPGPTRYTGADLARYRKERKLTQRAMAAMLQVSAGTISKAEHAPDKVVGRGLQAGMDRVQGGTQL